MTVRGELRKISDEGRQFSLLVVSMLVLSIVACGPFYAVLAPIPDRPSLSCVSDQPIRCFITPSLTHELEVRIGSGFRVLGGGDLTQEPVDLAPMPVKL